MLMGLVETSLFEFYLLFLYASTEEESRRSRLRSSALATVEVVAVVSPLVHPPHWALVNQKNYAQFPPAATTSSCS